MEVSNRLHLRRGHLLERYDVTHRSRPLVTLNLMGSQSFPYDVQMRTLQFESKLSHIIQPGELITNPATVRCFKDSSATNDTSRPPFFPQFVQNVPPLRQRLLRRRPNR